MLELVGVSKKYTAGNHLVHALKNFSITFKDNEFVSILGPSGSGKTTLMNIIGGLDRADSGKLIIDGVSTKKFRSRDWDDYRNKKIGFIFQSYNLIPHLTVFENVEIALTISGDTHKNKKDKVMKVLSRVGLAKEKNKKPNQLSGGQCQRVAIARALVNNPEIILADEPTGALDTKTSEQIMDLITEFAKDKLVIMVTHNPELAERYSSRIVRMKDGEIESDTEKKKIKQLDNAKEKQKKFEKRKKSRMSFFTALKLSLKNLCTKKGRTILTSFAGSIGIIGIALILSLSSGMSSFVNTLQRDMLSSTPITITSSTLDVVQAMTTLGNNEKLKEFPEAQKVFVEKSLSVQDLMRSNNITGDYIDYIGAMDSALYSDIMFKTGLKLNLYTIKEGTSKYSIVKENSGNSVLGFGSNMQMLPSDTFIKMQYDVLAGSYPENKNQVALVVDKTNEVSESVLVELGLKFVDEQSTELNFSSVLGKTFKALTNDELYFFDGTKYVEKEYGDIDFDTADTIIISGILRIKETVKGGALTEGLVYTKSLYNDIQTQNLSSSIVNFMNANPQLNPFTSEEYVNTLELTKQQQREQAFRALGGNALPSEISIYAQTYESKEQIKTYLNAFNDGKEDADKILYSDTSELFGSSITTIIDVITTVLIAFTAISLIVSSIMISIITFVSVLERTKEIGVLRAIGSRKKDVKRIFVAESFLIGLLAGLIGVIVTYLLSIPINALVYSNYNVPNISVLSPLYAIALILVSIALTVISGLIPANRASKKDPVVALRSE